MAEPSGSNFPTSLDSSTTLLADQVNQKSFTLSGAHNDTITTITTTATISGISAPNYVLINSEVIHFTGLSGADFTGCTRGADSTTATSHSDTDTIYHIPVANLVNQLKDAIIATQTELTVSPVAIGLACSSETADLTTGTAKITFRMPFAMTVKEVRANVNTAPVGSTIIVDINEGGTTILSTKLTIDASEETSETAATPAVISDSALADDAEITIDVDQIGSSTAGKGLKVWIMGSKT